MKKIMTAGGKREGAGRKKKENATKVVSFRVDAKSYDGVKKTHGRGLNKKINDFIKRLAKQIK